MTLEEKKQGAGGKNPQTLGGHKPVIPVVTFLTPLVKNSLSQKDRKAVH
jgi:hypothetical protein